MNIINQMIGRSLTNDKIAHITFFPCYCHDEHMILVSIDNMQKL